MATRKTIAVNGVTLSYLEQNEAAANTLFFIHGNSGSALGWRHQLGSSELSAYHLIAFDLPGHGQSGSVAADENILHGMASVLAVAVQELASGQPFLLIGHSLGTNLVAELLAHGLQPAGMALFGACVLGSGYTLQNIALEGADLLPLFSESATADALSNLAQSAFHQPDEALYQALFEDYQSTSAPVRPALLAAGIGACYSDEVALLKGADVPLLVVFGANERFFNPHYLDLAGLRLWKEQVIQVPDAGHFVQQERPGEANRLLRDYAEAQLTGSRTAPPYAAVR